MSAKPSRSVTVQDPQKGTTRAEKLGLLAVDGLLPLALIAESFSVGVAGGSEQLDVTAMHTRLAQTAQAASAGDLAALERMLSAQAQTLNAMFCELSRRAALNMGEHLDATDTYIRLALKAQGQCRATVETLGELKNPRSIAFVKQANIAQQQQVNNNAAQAEKITKPAIELLGNEPHERQWMDTRTPSTAARGNPAVETVGAVHRAEE